MLAGIRGEHVELATQQSAGSVRGKILVVEPLGAQTLVTVAGADTEVKVVTAPGYSAPPGGEVWLRPAPDKVRWYDPDSGAALTSP